MTPLSSKGVTITKRKPGQRKIPVELNKHERKRFYLDKLIPGLVTLKRHFRKFTLLERNENRNRIEPGLIGRLNTPTPDKFVT